MTFWANIYDKLSAEFKANFRDVNLTGVILSKSDGSPDIQQSGGNGDALVSLSTASTAVLASQATLAAVSAALAFPLHTAITPHDTNSVVATASKGIYVYGAGNLVYKTVGGATIGPVAVPACSYIPGQFALVLATSSTVTNVVGLS